MIPRNLVETAFRLWWLIPIPIIAVPLLVLIATRSPATYVSSANVWVTRPDGVDAGALVRNWSPYATPAQNQAAVMHDLLSTRTFRVEIAERAGLLPDNVDGLAREEFAREQTSGLAFSPAGHNVLRISASGRSPELVHNLVAATIDVYEARATIEVDRELGILRGYYTEQAAAARRVLDERQAELTAYVQQNPRAPDLGASDPAYKRLTDEVDHQQALVDDLDGSLQEVDLREASAQQGQQAVFNVVDEPSTPRNPEPRPLTSRVGYPVAGGLFGLVIAVFVVYAAFRTDQSIRSRDDLEGTTVPVLGYVPEVGPGVTAIFRRSGYARRVATSIGARPAEEGRH